MHGRAALALAALACAAATARGASADADAAVVVIRGSEVSAARPLTPVRALDGRTEVEIVRVEIAPAARPRPRAPERELVIVYLPVAAPAPPAALPLAWATGWPRVPRHRDFHPPRAHAGPRHPRHFPPGFHPLGLHRGPVRRALHRR